MSEHGYDHDGMWTNVDEFGGEKREHTHPSASGDVARLREDVLSLGAYDGPLMRERTVDALIAAIRAESGGLDVELMIKAMNNVAATRTHEMIVVSLVLYPADAALILAEYARLAEEVDAAHS